MSGAYGSGFLYSNADELVIWTRALAAGTLITKASYDKMITSYGFLWYTGASMGYGCSVNGDPVDEILVNGNLYGYTCCVHRYLAGDYTVVLLSNNDAVPIGRIAQGIKAILLGQDIQVTVAPEVRESADYAKYKHLTGDYFFPPTGWRFAVSFENGRLQVDRLFIQESKRQKFTLSLVKEAEGLVVLACEQCDSTFSFHLNSDGQIRNVVYAWDTLELPYEKLPDPDLR
ncbi:hypothetical protein [Gorillibacterium sp. sgz500922]|uniref:hypothetical protein n=1 Tax=Gorillibacterium sp. sgz500922 TaxID=3446694 RepID=UPI003F67B09B